MLGGARSLHGASHERADDGGVARVLLKQLDKVHLDVGERGATCDIRERTAREGCECHCAAIDMGMSTRERATAPQRVP